MYELIEIIFLRNGTVRTNKMKLENRDQKHANIAKEGVISVYPFSLITGWMSDQYFQLN